MRKISDTIARLAALQSQHTTPLSNSNSNRLSILTGFGSNPGALAAKFYIPQDLPDGAPLVVVLHGCTQSAEGYDHDSGWSQLADKEGFALLYPEQQRANNPNLCFNWFRPADTNRGLGEALSIRQMIEEMVAVHGLDGNRVFVTGLSAGGAMAGAMLASYPELFAGGAIIAGLPYGSATTVPEAFDRMRGHGGKSEQELQTTLRAASPHQGPWPKISIWQGSADHTVASSNAGAIAAQWRNVHALDIAPTLTETNGKRARQVWCNASGEAMIELNMIAGMGHGTPLDNRLGTAGPYMLDVGISSTREIARFWGVTGTASQNSAAPFKSPTRKRTERSPIRSPEPNLASRESRSTFPAPSTSDTVPEVRGVGKVIEDALRAAGLMR